MSEVRTNGNWKYFATEADAKSAAQGLGARVRRYDWDGPGWYYVTVYQQRCPRNCCYDSVFHAESGRQRADSIRERMVDFASELKDARSRQRMPVGPT